MAGWVDVSNQPDTAPLKMVERGPEPLLEIAHRAHRAIAVLTLTEQAIATSLAATLIFAADRLAGVIG